jgi:hypothetical protein
MFAYSHHLQRPVKLSKIETAMKDQRQQPTLTTGIVIIAVADS